MMPRQILLASSCLAIILVSCGRDLKLTDRYLSATTRPDSPLQAVLKASPKKVPSRSKSSITYQPSEVDFLNPERGFHDVIDLMEADDFRLVRRKGHSIARTYIRLDEYRNRLLPEDFLIKLRQQLQLVRAAGIKIVLRFSYNFPSGNGGDYKNAADANLDLTLAHIQQLKPILQENADVIAVLQGGFVGAWGEWHSSGSGLDRPEAKAKILNALLDALSSNRMVQLRYPKDIREIYPQPLASTEAFRGTDRSRVGFTNDCFLSNLSDSGTYSPTPAALKNYTSQIAPFTAIGGETCAVSPLQQRTDCQTAESELARYHWSYLNSYFYKPAIDRWKREGCHGRISRNLGYRFQLISADFPARVRRTRPLTGNFTIQNVGYTSPFNPRNLELILRHQPTGKVYHLPLLEPLSKTHDPRWWQPQAGEISVDISVSIPANAPLGAYELLLNLPDPIPTLANRPEYSIRLANEGIWEAKTGFNSLRKTIHISRY